MGSPADITLLLLQILQEEQAAFNRFGNCMDTLLQILMVFFLMSLGAFARRRGLLSRQGTGDLARLLVAIFYPALIFDSITRLTLGELWEQRAMPAMTLLIAGVGLVLGLLTIHRIKPENPGRAGAFLFQSTINNYLFLPLPLVALRFGQEGLSLLVFAAMGFELTVWSVGVLFFNRVRRVAEGVRIMLGPPMIAMLVSVFWMIARDLAGWRIPLPEALARVPELMEFGITTVGRATVAVSMIVAGSRISVLRTKSIQDPHVWQVSLLRLVVIPVLAILLLNRMQLGETARGVLCVVAVMPAAITSLIFSERFNGDSEFIAASLLLTHLLAVVTVPVLLLWAL